MDENGFFMPLDDENVQDPPATLNLRSMVTVSNGTSDGEAMELVSDDEEATRPAFSSSSSSGAVVVPTTGDDDEETNLLMRQMLDLAGDSIPFVCVAPPNKVAASVVGGHGTASFCHVAKYLARSSGGDGDVAWAARMLAYASARDHHTVPVARTLDEFQRYTHRMEDLKKAADLLVREHPNCCVAIQEDWPQQAGLGRIYMRSSFTRRHVWSVLRHVFDVLRCSMPFYEEQQVEALLDDNLTPIWSQILQELRAQRVLAQNNI
jgi:hypothetical protein